MSWEPHKLYILLSPKTTLGAFHWGIYLTESDASQGIIYQLIKIDGNKWSYDEKLGNPDLDFGNLVTALEIGEDIQNMREIVGSAVSSVWEAEYKLASSDSNSQLFVLRCIEELDERGVIALRGNLSDVEREAHSVGLRSHPVLSPRAQHGAIWKSTHVC